MLFHLLYFLSLSLFLFCLQFPRRCLRQRSRRQLSLFMTSSYLYRPSLPRTIHHAYPLTYKQLS